MSKPGITIDQEYELVDVKRLKEHPRNPKKGHVQAIDRSMEINDWYGAVTAQKSTGYILAGNHRFRVAKKRGAKQVPVIWRDVDDATALRILLADNRTADLGTYDDAKLQKVLEGLETLDGTGWDPHLEALAEADEKGDEGAEEAPEDVPDDKYTPSWGVIVVCEDEAHQEEVYESLRGEGYQVRVVAV